MVDEQFITVDSVTRSRIWDAFLSRELSSAYTYMCCCYWACPDCQQYFCWQQQSQRLLTGWKPAKAADSKNRHSVSDWC